MRNNNNLLVINEENIQFNLNILELPIYVLLGQVCLGFLLQDKNSKLIIF